MAASSVPLGASALLSTDSAAAHSPDRASRATAADAPLPPQPSARACPVAVPVSGHGGVPGPHCTPLEGDRIVLLGVSGGPGVNPFAVQTGSVLVVEDALYVVDCGQGTVRNIVLTALDLGKVNNLFITHNHPDHICDYEELLIQSYMFVELFGGEGGFGLDVWGPKAIKGITKDLLDPHGDFIAGAEDLFQLPELAGAISTHGLKLRTEGLVMEDDRVRVSALRVPHDPFEEDTFAYKFETARGTVVFSGDTPRFDPIIDFSAGADVLVHEALYFPDLQGVFGDRLSPDQLENFKQTHTEAEEVGRIAAAADVKRLVLNHLIPIFTGDDVWEDEVRKHYGRELIVGKDRMQISLDPVPAA